MDWLNKRVGRAVATAAAILLTGAGYYIACGLHRLWWPVWIAPIPILLLAPKLRGWQIFAAGLVARALAAGFDFWFYIHNVVNFPVWLTAVTILVPGMYFGLGAVLYRRFLRTARPWCAALAFPAVIVTTEYLFSLWQGSYFSTGYTQLENLPVLQLAALGGLWGISFAVNLLPAGLSATIAIPARPRMRMAAGLAAIYALVLGYGFFRLHDEIPNPNTVVVGMAETHPRDGSLPQTEAVTMPLMQEYAAQVQPLAARGAQFVVLPEMTALVFDPESARVDALFEKTAREAHTEVLLGVLHVTGHGNYNEGRLYSAAGQLEAVYRKHHLVPTWERQSTPGTEMFMEQQEAGKIGLEICRDMDYTDIARQYGREDVGLMLVPAWDQGLNVDAEGHGHLAIMRGVEDGFTIARNAKIGLLTVSDDRGRVLKEEPTHDDGSLVTMVATVPVHHDPTLYQRWGDWFAWVNLAGLAVLGFVAGRGCRGIEVARGTIRYRWA